VTRFPRHLDLAGKLLRVEIRSEKRIRAGFAKRTAPETCPPLAIAQATVGRPLRSSAGTLSGAIGSGSWRGSFFGADFDPQEFTRQIEVARNRVTRRILPRSAPR